MDAEEEVALSMANYDAYEEWRKNQLKKGNSGALQFWLLLVVMIGVLLYVYFYIYHGELVSLPHGNAVSNVVTIP